MIYGGLRQMHTDSGQGLNHYGLKEITSRIVKRIFMFLMPC